MSEAAAGAERPASERPGAERAGGPPANAWWRDFFDDSYFDLHASLFPEAESRREVAAMAELLGLPQDARILDLPCGWGRHTALFPEAGMQTFGADLSVPLLRRAADALADAGASLRLAAADLRELPFADASFDAAVNVFTSLGLLLDDEEDLRALREVRRVLRPDGAFLLESMHRDDVIAHYARRDRWTLPDGTEVRVRRRFDPVTGISHERLRWRRRDSDGTASRGEKRHALRLRTATEIDRLLKAAGFTRIVYFGDWDGSALEHDSERVIARAAFGGAPRRGRGARP